MVNRYLVCALYLISLQAAVMAGGYVKEGKALTSEEGAITPADPSTRSSTDMVTTKEDEKPAISVKPSLKNKDDPFQNTVSSLGVGGSYFGEYSPYPDNSSPYPSPSVGYPGSSSSFPGHSLFYPGYSSPGSSGTYPTTPDVYPGTPRGYPGHAFSSPFPCSSGTYPSPSSVYPGFLGTVIPPVSTDYVSRYQGPGTIPVVLTDGTVADTPEVIAARAAHLTALQSAQAILDGLKDDGTYNHLKYGVGIYPALGSSNSLVSGPAGHHSLGAGYSGTSASGYQSPIVSGHQGPVSPAYQTPLDGGNQGVPVTGYQGHLISGHRPVSPAYQTPLDGSNQGVPVTGYQGPLAIPTVLPSGYLADTPEVVAARLAHLGAVIRASELHSALSRAEMFEGVGSEKYTNHI